MVVFTFFRVSPSGLIIFFEEIFSVYNSNENKNPLKKLPLELLRKNEIE